eukprot:11148701-Karenia_brevis.AAC.1
MLTCTSQKILRATTTTQPTRMSLGLMCKLCIDDHMSKVILNEEQYNSMTDGAAATLRVYLAGNPTKRSVVVKDDEILTKHDRLRNATEVAEATVAELKV